MSSPYRAYLGIVLAVIVACAASGPGHAEEQTDAPKAIPRARSEFNAVLGALTRRTPRLELPAAESGTPMLGYLPASWGGGGGLGGPGQVNPRAVPDRSGRYPDPLKDPLFTDASFWVVSRANNCHYCLGHQELKLRAGGLPDEAVTALDCDWSAFSPPQQAALAFARRLTLEPGAVGDADVANLKKHFTDAEIIELAFAIARFNSVNRWTDALGLPLEHYLDGDGSPAPPGDGDLPSATSIVTPNARPAHVLQSALPSADEIGAAIEACRQRQPRVALPSEDAARAALAGVVLGRAPLLWERALAGLPIVGRTHVLVWNTIQSDNHLPPQLKLEVAYITAVNNRAWYAAGTAAGRLKLLGASDDELAALIAADEAGDVGAAAAHRLARKLTVLPQQITDADIATVQRHFSDGETAEIIQVICLANLFDRFTSVLGLPLESQ